jgi:hypothetical protein
MSIKLRALEEVTERFIVIVASDDHDRVQTAKMPRLGKTKTQNLGVLGVLALRSLRMVEVLTGILSGIPLVKDKDALARDSLRGSLTARSLAAAGLGRRAAFRVIWILQGRANRPTADGRCAPNGRQVIECGRGVGIADDDGTAAVAHDDLGARSFLPWSAAHRAPHEIEKDAGKSGAAHSFRVVPGDRDGLLPGVRWHGRFADSCLDNIGMALALLAGAEADREAQKRRAMRNGLPPPCSHHVLAFIT